MTNNSYICNFIKENPYDWKEKLSKNPYFLKINEDDGLCIFNYNMLAFEVVQEATEESEAIIARTNFSLPIVQEARGIIIDPQKCEVVCWPFRKFGNYGESYVDTIDWKSASVQTKVDGSIMKVWFDKRSEYNTWRVSSNSIINAYNNQNGLYINYGKIFDEAAKDVLDYSILDKDYTYIFELVSPKTRVVIEYPETKIYHIGTRSNITGKEYRVDIGVEKPKEYRLNSLNECIKAANMLNQAQNDSRFDVEYEGFVVCDKDFNRIKIKSPEYLMAHNALNNGVLSYKRTFELIENNEIEEYATYFPQHLDVLRDYEKKYYTVLNNMEKYINYAKNLYEKCGHDTKAFALITKNDKYASFAFSAIKRGKEDVKELFSDLHLENKKTLLENVDNFLKDNPSFKECTSIDLEL